MKTWIPIESDPELITKYARELGMSDNFEFTDLLSFYADEAAMLAGSEPSINETCQAMILLFPLKGQLNKAEEAASEDSANGQVMFVKQTIENSCGFMAILHILLNNEQLNTEKSAIIKELRDSLKGRNSTEAPLILENHKSLDDLHKKYALLGQTEAPTDPDAIIDLHFVALVPVDGQVWILDGRQAGPQLAGTMGEETFLEAACRVAREEFVDKVEDEAEKYNFSALICVPQ